MPALRVLIVEDDLTLRRAYRTALHLAGYDVDEAADGFQAMQALEARAPDLILLDLGLPIISGYELRTEIAAHAHTRDIPIVVVTGAVGPLDDLDPVACILRKPVSVDDIVEAVTECLASRGGSTAAG
jgi:CheY-like chemotaxis protein